MAKVKKVKTQNPRIKHIKGTQDYRPTQAEVELSTVVINNDPEREKTIDLQIYVGSDISVCRVPLTVIDTINSALSKKT